MIKKAPYIYFICHVVKVTTREPSRSRQSPDCGETLNTSACNVILVKKQGLIK